MIKQYEKQNLNMGNKNIKRIYDKRFCFKWWTFYKKYLNENKYNWKNRDNLIKIILVLVLMNNLLRVTSCQEKICFIKLVNILNVYQITKGTISYQKTLILMSWMNIKKILKILVK